MRRTIAALAAALLLLAACGSDSSDSVATTTTEPGASAPERILSLSPTATEMLFAIGAGDQVVAVDDQSDFPPDAPTTDLSGFQPNLEAISTYQPDLVVVDGTDQELVAGLETVGIEVFEAPVAATLEDTYDQVSDLGETTGHADEAGQLVDEMKREIAQLVDEVPDRATPLTYYHELDDTLYSVTSGTFIGQLYGLAGLESVADAVADDQSGGFPQLSAEFLVAADPDIVFLADTECCQQDAETFAARPGFGDLTAVRSGQVVELDDDVASRWGPRVVDFLRVIVDSVRAIPNG